MGSALARANRERGADSSPEQLIFGFISLFQSPAGEQIVYIFIAIDRALFEKEASTTQQFLYFPQLNKRPPQ